MRSPLGPILADFFMSSIEQELATDIVSLAYYKRCVDDTLVFRLSRHAIDNLVQRFNSCHPNLKVTCEFETDNCLPFLDILISRREDGSIKRAVYRKSTWSGQYLNFSSFTLVRHKRALVNTLFTRARQICTQDSHAKELDLITSTHEHFALRFDRLRRMTHDDTHELPVIKNADMPEDMQQYAIGVCEDAMDRYKLEREIARHVKKGMDEHYGSTWHCVVGSNFGRDEVIDRGFVFGGQANCDKDYF
ncbi:uncharacterized protein DEA37_0013030 [Paragonimus westermani]|uniref:Dynein light chain 1, cytoplasmic n=1 Tax=Paragonimus westermani TaxID=34504 RepID=A0A5J4ND21_9TREM|nr:uncharacterized protein DEA37_0013030 [Paragonimus westermani]